VTSSVAGFAVPAFASTQGGPATTSTSPTDGGWTQVYHNDFTSLTSDINRSQSAPSVNDAVQPSDNTNKQLQKPTVASDVNVVSDPAATDGSALDVATRQASYQNSAGTQYGWTNGRMDISSQNQAPPVRITARLRMTPSVGAKTAVMWWPAGGGWPWEVDFAENSGGTVAGDYWGSRQHISENFHSDINHDGAAVEQIHIDTNVDTTVYHDYTLTILPGHMWVEIDGVKVAETTDPKWIPTGNGFFGIGKALTGTRSGTHTNDDVYLDSLSIYKPTPGGTIALPTPTPSSTVAPVAGKTAPSVTVTGTVTGGPGTRYHLQYGRYGSFSSSTPDAVVPAGAAATSPVSVALSGLAPASTYGYRMVVANDGGTSTSASASLSTGAVPSAKATSIAVTPAGVSVAAPVNTGGLDTSAVFNYTPTAGGTTQHTAPVSVPASASSAQVGLPSATLTPGVRYTVTTTVTNQAGTKTNYGSQFVAPSAPKLPAVIAVTKADTGLTVSTKVAPGNLPTTVQVNYGTSTGYGTQGAIVTVPGGTTAVPVTLSLGKLTAGTVYHLQVVASNASGSVISKDVTTGTTGKPAVTASSAVRTSYSPSAATVKVTGSVASNSLATSYVIKLVPVAPTSAAAVTSATFTVNAGLNPVAVSRLISGLARHTVYNVTIVATNADGVTSSPALQVNTN
jgi:hypothetical protein